MKVKKSNCSKSISIISPHNLDKTNLKLLLCSDDAFSFNFLRFCKSFKVKITGTTLRAIHSIYDQTCS